MIKRIKLWVDRTWSAAAKLRGAKVSGSILGGDEAYLIAAADVVVKCQGK